MNINTILKPEFMATLDVAVLVALGVAILVGLRLCARLKALRKAHAEWNKELQTFAERADAAEAGLERLRTALLAEAEHKRTMERLAEKSSPVVLPKKVPAPIVPVTTVQNAYRPAPAVDSDFFDEEPAAAAPPAAPKARSTPKPRRTADAVLSMQ